MSYFVYKFIDFNLNVIYVGKTHDVKQRMREHFLSAGHLPETCYRSVSQIYYADVGTEFNAELFETLLIHRFSPTYNTDKKFKCHPDDIDMEHALKNLQWKELFFYIHANEDGAAISIEFPKSRYPFSDQTFPTDQIKAASEYAINFIRYRKRAMDISNISKEDIKALEDLYQIAYQNRDLLYTEIRGEKSLLAFRMKDDDLKLSKRVRDKFIVKISNDITQIRLPFEDASHIQKTADHTEEVLSWINKFKQAESVKPGKVLSKYRNGYCYFFAVMLKHAFQRGSIEMAVTNDHIVWKDIDNTKYDIGGIYKDETRPIREKELKSFLKI